MPTAEEQVLADAILRHRPLTLDSAVRAVLRAAGEYVPEEEEALLRAYADSINIDMVPDGFRYVSRSRVRYLMALESVIDHAAQILAGKATCIHSKCLKWQIFSRLII